MNLVWDSWPFTHTTIRLPWSTPLHLRSCHTLSQFSLKQVLQKPFASNLFTIVITQLHPSVRSHDNQWYYAFCMTTYCNVSRSGKKITQVGLHTSNTASNQRKLPRHPTIASIKKRMLSPTAKRCRFTYLQTHNAWQCSISFLPPMRYINFSLRLLKLHICIHILDAAGLFLCVNILRRMSVFKCLPILHQFVTGNSTNTMSKYKQFYPLRNEAS